MSYRARIGQPSQRQADEFTIRKAYQVTFNSLHGQLVLQHLFDTIYCQVYEGTDAQAALVFNARRSVIHEILYNVDVATRPDHYTVKEPINA